MSFMDLAATFINVMISVAIGIVVLIFTSAFSFVVLIISSVVAWFDFNHGWMSKYYKKRRKHK